MDSPVAAAHRLLAEAIDALAAAAESGAAGDAELLSALILCEGVTRRLDRLTLATISTLQRRGAFTERGYKSTAAALGDLLGWEAFEAGRRVHAADQVCPRVGLDGTVLPPRLAATAAVFEAGQARLRHVEVIARLLDSPAAHRLTRTGGPAPRPPSPRRPPNSRPPRCGPGAHTLPACSACSCRRAW